MIPVKEQDAIIPCIAAAIPFPPVSWWKVAIKAKTIWLDPFEHFQKMSYRNRYYLAGKEGKALLSLPLQKGRNQQLAMREMQISYAENWQKNHWRTLQTLLGNSPFFEYIDYQLFSFFESKEPGLYNWNKASIEWANQFLGHPIEIRETDRYIQNTGSNLIDLRDLIHPKSDSPPQKEYYQVFKSDAGFLPDCSILDLICCEGKNALNILLDSGN